jgi:cbb3-type cytochrome oxidase subunit 3
MLSQMVAKLFAGNPLTMFPSVGLAIFMGVFISVTVSVMRRKAAAYEEIARLPLDDDEVNHGR